MHAAMPMQNRTPRFQLRAGVDRLAHDESAGMGELLRMLRVDEVEALQKVDMPAVVRRLREGETLFHEGAQAEAIYFVRGGTFKTFCTGEDGYEQVLCFSVRGELLGFDAIGSGHYSSNAVALEESSVYAVLLRDYFDMSSRNAALDRAVLRVVSDALRHRGELADVMAAVAAEVRLARFLIHLSRRMVSCGQSGRKFHLRMARRDIASYLGVAHETVSRSFSALMGLGLLSVDNREVEILDMQGLHGFASGTRRQVDDSIRLNGSRRAPASCGAVAMAA
jgi:CRP/FNR family transcriptional regulator, anaerobic regulatory protein